MKTLKQLREDSRIDEIVLLDQNVYESKYAIYLNDCYTFDGYSRVEFCDTVVEINEIMLDVAPLTVDGITALFSREKIYYFENGKELQNPPGRNTPVKSYEINYDKNTVYVNV
jgi:hypothetical protein